MRSDGLALLGLEWARPTAAWALLAGPLLLLFVRLLARPPERVTGTLALWRQLPESRGGAARRVLVAPWVLVTVLALVLGALAWMGPRPALARAPRTWTVVLDRSRSMGLALAPGASERRLDAALAAAHELLGRALASADRVRWQSTARAPLELAPGAEPPAAWLAPDASEEPDWAAFDRPGTLWVTDRAPGLARAHAGLVASGGSEVPGAIAVDGAEGVWWEGGTLARRARAAPPTARVEEPDGAHLPAVLEDVLAAWCDGRGFARTRAPAPDELFVLALAPGEPAAEELAFGRDGWRATGHAVPLAPLASGEIGAETEIWLSGASAGSAQRPLVRVGAGRIEVALRSLAPPAGDPAAFALSWARLFERACTLPADVVPLGEREPAGAPAQALGEAPPEPPRAQRLAGPTVDAGLALGAALLAALAFVLARRG